jgi:uncharacterized protein
MCLESSDLAGLESAPPGYSHPSMSNEPSTVAVLGASRDRTKFGNKAVRAFRQQGYTVYPINPNEAEIEGLPCFASVSELPTRPNRITVYLPPHVTPALLPAIAARGCDQLWLNPGSESPEIVRAAQRLGLNVVQACSILDIGVSPATL